MIMEVRNFNLQWFTGVGAALWGSFTPIQDMLLGVFIFIAVDFVVGVIASYKRSKRRKVRWYFESAKAWNTIYKLAFSLIAVSLSFYLDTKIFDFVDLKLPNMVAGFVCGTEFWSFLENAGDISDHPVFRAIRRITKRKINRIIDAEDSDEILTEECYGNSSNEK